MGDLALNVGTIAGGMNIKPIPDAAEPGLDRRRIAGRRPAQPLRGRYRVPEPLLDLPALLGVGRVFTGPDDPWLRRVFAAAQHLNQRIDDRCGAGA